jgi:hypothetical protein
MSAAAPIPYRPEGKPPSIKSLWLGVLVAATALYAATCQRTLSWQDSGMFQWRVAVGDYAGELGLALAHPLYIAAGQAVTLLPGSDAYWLNCFSGVGMAVALANLAAIVCRLTGRRWAGAATAAMLAVTHTVWWLSTVAEVYTWSAAGLTAELWMLVALLERPRPRLLAGLALVNGLGLCVHNFALLPLPVYATVAVWLVAKRRLAARWLAVAAVAWLAGAGIYTAQTAHLALREGVTLAEAVHSALFGGYADAVLNVSAVSDHPLPNALLGGLNFVNLLLPLAVFGWIRLRRWTGTPAPAALAAITVIEAVFVLRYPVPDQFTFLLPTLVMVALAAGLGAAAIARGSRRRRWAVVAACAVSIAAMPALYAAAPHLAQAAGVHRVRARELPFRNELNYWLEPWKHDETSAARFAREAVDRAADAGGVIVADNTAVWPLLLERRRRGGPENVAVQLYDDPLPPYLPRKQKHRRDPAAVARSKRAFREALAGRALYVVSPERAPEGLAADADFEPLGNGVLYRVLWKGPPPNAPGNGNLKGV